MMPRPPSGATIVAAATAVPRHTISSAEVKEHFPKAFALDPARLTMMRAIVDNAQVHNRHLLYPWEQTIQPRLLEQTTEEYKTHSVRLGCQVAKDALAKANLDAGDIDLLITVSCTGFMIPSLDAHLINELGFEPSVKRLPITELGCAAGAAALCRAADYIRAFPDAHVLVVAVELASLTFQRSDLSPAHLISCVLFGDGAAAAIVSGPASRGLRVIDTQSHLIANSLGAMGFDLKSSGFHIVLDKNVPQLVRDEIGPVVRGLLERHSLDRSNLSFFLLHPGGQKLLANIEAKLGLSREDTALSWCVLGKYGNLSSATVLFILKEFFERPAPSIGERGLLAAFGPGFSMEMALLEWN